MKTLANVSFIVIGVAIASYGEIKFDLVGFLGVFTNFWIWCFSLI